MSVHKQDVNQFIRYVLVGVMNTLVTLIVIFMCKSFFGINLWVSNAIGYVAGMVNSFLWNRTWVFHSTSRKYHREALKFIVGFLVCYGVQLVVTWAFNGLLSHVQIVFYNFTVSGYGIATIIGMAVYTMLNFVFNRLITFKSA